MRACAVIPTYNNPQTIRGVVDRVRKHMADVIVVDDGSGEKNKAELAKLEQEGRIILVTRAQNGGKGAAVKSGLKEAAARGYSHAMQVDADGQHDTSAIPTFLAVAEKHPTALLLGYPIFDRTVPWQRLIGRYISIFWTAVETRGRVIQDPLCGFRVYPLPLAATLKVRGDRMDYDPEVAVRLVWAGARVANLPVRVRYLTSDEGGISHFHLFWDNVRISLMHSLLVMEMMIRSLIPGSIRRSGRVSLDELDSATTLSELE